MGRVACLLDSPLHSDVQVNAVLDIVPRECREYKQRLEVSLAKFEVQIMEMARTYD